MSFDFQFGDKFRLSFGWMELFALAIVGLVLYMVITGTSPMQLFRELLGVVPKQ